MTFDDSGDVEHVTKEKFIEHVESLGAKDYKNDNELGAPYKIQNEIAGQTKTENRTLTVEEMAELIALRHKTYAMFAELCPKP